MSQSNFSVKAEGQTKRSKQMKKRACTGRDTHTTS